MAYHSYNTELHAFRDLSEERERMRACSSRDATPMFKLGGVEFDRIVLSLELDEWMRRLQGKETF